MTSFDELIERTARKLEKDSDLFNYYNISSSEAEALLKEQITGYIYDAVDILYNHIDQSDNISFYDYDDELKQFNFDLTNREIGLLSNLMRQVYYERQEAMLGAFKIRMSPSDLSIFSPASERTSFENMLKTIRQENDIALSHYASTDRLTGKKKTIDHSQYDYTS